MYVPARIARAATCDYEVSPQAQFRLWFDDEQEVVYGFYLSFNESTGDTRDFYEDPRFAAFARTLGFGIIGTQISDDPNETEHSDDIIDLLDFCAGMTGHPELANVPVITEGISLGGHNSIKFAAVHPDRAIAYLGGGASYLPDEVSNPDFAQVPGLFYHGETDTDPEERLAELAALRADGAQVAHFTQWDFGHERGYSINIGWKFLSDAVYLRYPVDANPLDGPVDLIDIPTDSGWVADYQTWDSAITAIAPFADAASASDDFWLPTRDSAYVYRAHSTRDRPIAFVAPSASDNPQWTRVEPGDDVPIEVSAGGLGNVETIEVFDGSRSIAELSSAPYETTWAAEGIGAHALVAVATLTDGSQRTGYSVPVLVEGTIEHPGGGLPSPGGGGGDDGGDDDGGGGDDGGGDGGGGDDGDGDGDGGDGGGCQAAGGSGSPATALLFLLAFVGARGIRKRRGRSS